MAYEIENANNHNLSKMAIKEQLDRSAERGMFPSNLEYVDSYTDSLTGVTTSAFLNKDTGKVTLGMTGTNIMYRIYYCRFFFLYISIMREIRNKEVMQC